jgi:hypothetical protein
MFHVAKEEHQLVVVYTRIPVMLALLDHDVVGVVDE